MRIGTPRVGRHMTTITGRKFYPLDPRPEDICIEDIAHALSMKCRWGGHVWPHYSVAEHSVRVAWLVPEELRLRALMHDASEAYLEDIPSPVKHTKALTGYRELETQVQDIITTIYCGSKTTPEQYAVIKAADKRVCEQEARDLFSPSRTVYEGVEPMPDVIVPWSALSARNRFLRFYHELHDKEMTPLISRLGLVA